MFSSLNSASTFSVLISFSLSLFYRKISEDRTLFLTVYGSSNPLNMDYLILFCLFFSFAEFLIKNAHIINVKRRYVARITNIR